jgi:colanic acid/amylovoran biosynthesis glycosyltransferase
MPQQFPLKIAYLVSEYPAFSHTFIMREVNTLRNLGADIQTASINESKIPSEQLGIDESQAISNTFYIKKQGLFKSLSIFLKTFFLQPLSVLKGITYASHLAGWDLKKQLYHQFYLIEALLVAEWMQNRGLKHLHVHFANPASTVALFVHNLFSTPFSITVHGPDEFYNANENLIEEKAKKAKFICCISDYAKSQLMRCSSSCHWDKFETTPLGINPSQFPSKRFGSESQLFQMLCVGRLVPSKGQQLLIAAVHQLVMEGRDIILKLIGDGPERHLIEEQIRRLQLEEHVILLGALPQKDVLEEYQQTDLFVLASFAEGVPIVLMEAMSIEISCIAPHLHGIPELIRDDIDGILFSPANEEELARSIAAMIDQPEKRERLGKAGRRRIQEKYNLEHNVEYLYKVFLERI